MRLKTLGVFMVTALALFTAYFWLTDAGRRETVGHERDEQLLEYGQELFGAPSSEVPFTANCAQCHGPEGRGGTANTPDGPVPAPDLHSLSLAQKWEDSVQSAANPENPYDKRSYINKAIRYGGVVVSGNVNSPMPAWSYEVGGGLNEEQLAALTLLVTNWAQETLESPPLAEEVEDTVESGQLVFSAAGCAGCHGAELEGGSGPNLQTIGSEPVTDLPTPISQLDKLIADYEEDPRNFLELWIRDSHTNYNDGEPTGMPRYPEEDLTDSQLQALITFLLAQTGE